MLLSNGNIYIYIYHVYFNILLIIGDIHMTIIQVKELARIRDEQGHIAESKKELKSD